MNVTDRYVFDIQVYDLQWELLNTNYVVQTPAGVLYLFYISYGTTNYGDAVYCKSTDYGRTWGSEVVIKAMTGTHIAVWADWWSGITATAYIHIAYIDSDSDDTFYRYLDTATDSLGTERTVFAGSSTANGGTLSITRARGGNLICATCIDAGAEYDTVKSADLFVNKTSIAEVFEGATYDTVSLVPNPDSADNQDILAFFWDSSADEISLKKYDDSANSWSESSLATGMVDVGSFLAKDYGVALDLTNNNVLFAAWSAHDTANADLRIWSVDDSAATELTNIVLNSADDQAFIALTVCPNNLWYAFYCGKSDGSETIHADTNIYYKISTDNGSTWGSETALTNIRKANIYCLIYIPYCYAGEPILAYPRLPSAAASYVFTVNVPSRGRAKASYQLGM